MWMYSGLCQKERHTACSTRRDGPGRRGWMNYWGRGGNARRAMWFKSVTFSRGSDESISIRVSTQVFSFSFISSSWHCWIDLGVLLFSPKSCGWVSPNSARLLLPPTACSSRLPLTPFALSVFKNLKKFMISKNVHAFKNLTHIFKLGIKDLQSRAFSVGHVDKYDKSIREIIKIFIN